MMMRTSLFAALALIGCLATAQDVSSKINFKAPAGPAKRVLEDLSKVAGIPLSAAGPVADDVILVHVSDVTVGEVMTKIATALNGEWRKEGTGMVFYRGSNFEAADKRAENATRVAEFRASLGRILEEQQKLGAFDESSAKKLLDLQKKMSEEMSRTSSGGVMRLSGDFESASRQTPAARTIVALLSRVSDAQIAALTSGDRVVFSLHPTRMQMPMPNGANQILQQFIRDTRTFKDVSQRNAPPAGTDNRRIVINGFGSGDGSGDGDPNLGIGYAMLIRNPSFSVDSGTSVNLLVADPNGRTTGSGQFFVPPATGPFATGNQTNQPAGNEKPMEFSDLTKELAKVLPNIFGGGASGGTVRVMSVAISSSGSGSSFTLGGGGGKTPKISAELREKLLSPEQHDPLSFGPGEGFSLIAESKGIDLVAYLPDQAFQSLNQAVNGNPTPTSFLNAAQRVSGLQVTEGDGWMVVSPKSPSSSRERRVNRAALGQALRLLNSKGYLALDDWAAFASKQVKNPRNGEIDDSYLRLINSPAADAGLGQFNFGGGWQTLQFYASLSAAQRQTLAQSGQVALRTLSQYQIGLVNEQIYNTFDGPNVVNRQQQGRALPFYVGMQSALTERTIVLPNGMPRDGFLTFTLKTNEIAQANSSQAEESRFMTAESLAFEKVRSERPELASFGAPVQYDQYRMANQRTIGFLFQLTPEVALSRQLEDNTPGNQAFASYDRLPADFKQKVEKAYESLKQGWGTGIGGGGNQVPPP